jgi:hypothetical protein
VPICPWQENGKHTRAYCHRHDGAFLGIKCLGQRRIADSASDKRQPTTSAVISGNPPE